MKRSIPWLLLLVIASGALSTIRSPVAACELSSEFQDGERKDYARLANSCVKCHADVTAEHQASGHAQSWSDPVFQAELKSSPDKADSCARCHAPREILDAGIGNLPSARATARELGVSCITCHMKKNEYFGPFTSKGHGGVEASAWYRESKMCASCHGQPEARKEHEQFSSFVSSPAAKGGATCQSCHMPEVTRELVTDPKIRPEFKIGAVAARKHTFGGVRHGTLVEKSADLGVTSEGNKVVVKIKPKTGHAMPASYGRKVILVVAQRAADGSALATESVIFEAPGSVLAPDVTSERTFPSRAGASSVVVTLTHNSPKAPGRDADDVQLIATTTLKLP